MSTDSSVARDDLAPTSARDRAEALRVLVQVDNLLDDLCWRLLDLYGRPTVELTTQERQVCI